MSAAVASAFEEPSFEDWYKELSVLAAQEGWDIGTFEDREIWMDYYLDGDDPFSALQDDINHA